MPEQNPLEPFLDQISKFLETYDQNRETKLTGVPTSQDIADLMNVMARVDAMKEAYEIAKKEQGLTEEEIANATRKQSEQLSPKQKQILNKIERMRAEIQREHQIIDITIKQERQKKIQSGQMFKSKKKKKHKSLKSLNISFRKGWKKM